MLNRYHLTPDQVDELPADFIDELEAHVWAENQHKNIQKQRDAMSARAAQKRQRHSRR